MQGLALRPFAIEEPREINPSAPGADRPGYHARRTDHPNILFERSNFFR
jgi:hypothetical protein